MKKLLLASALATVCGVGALASSTALAADGTITFNGSISSATCTVTGGGGATGTGNITVTMAPVSQQALTAANSTAGQTPFQLNLSGANCTNGLTAAMWVETASTPDLDTTTNNLKNHVSGGSNVEVQLVNPVNNQQILLGTNATVVNGSAVVPSNNQPAATISSNTATLKYLAQYVNTVGASKVTPGAVQSALTYSIQYN